MTSVRLSVTSVYIFLLVQTLIFKVNDFWSRYLAIIKDISALEVSAYKFSSYLPVLTYLLHSVLRVGQISDTTNRWRNAKVVSTKLKAKHARGHHAG